MATGGFSEYFGIGLYATNLGRFLASVPREQMLILEYREFRS
jgi:hypothetical protein